MARTTKPKKSRLPASEDLGLSHVLIVEDDPVLAMGTEEMLLAGGVDQVDVCPTTESAMAVLRDKMPQAIVLDVHLADRNDGWAIAELVEALGENRPRIVFATGAPEDIPPAIADLGTVVAKPYSPDDLMAALRGGEHRGLFARLRGNA